MKKILFFIILLCPMLAIADNADPFYSGAWYIDNFSLTTQYHSPFDNNDHSISYVLPDGTNTSTDMCSLKSPTILSCITGDSISYNAAAHSATLSGGGHPTYVYYEKGYQPKGSLLSGIWHAEPKCKEAEVATLIVPYAEKEATVISDIEEDDDNGGFSRGNTYYLAKDKFSKTLYFGPYTDMSYDGFDLYDANNVLINDMSNMSTLAKLKYHGTSCFFVKS